MSVFSESQHYTRLIENLKLAEEHATGLGYCREDTRWIQIATMIHQMRANVAAMAEKSARQALTFLNGIPR
ncbi:MAG: hypothetical protein KGJ13_08360 [Patescibacteria group bacterium]|nr:hypothetical protein [Patescibacteria group bacterium]